VVRARLLEVWRCVALCGAMWRYVALWRCGAVAVDQNAAVFLFSAGWLKRSGAERSHSETELGPKFGPKLHRAGLRSLSGFWQSHLRTN